MSFRSSSPFKIAAIVAALWGCPASGQSADGLRLEPYDFETRAGQVVAAELGRLAVPERHEVAGSKRIKLAFVRLVSDTVAQLETAPRRVATRDALTGAPVEVAIGAFDFQLFTTAVLARRRTIELIPSAFLPIAKGDFSVLASFVPSQMRRESLSAMGGAMPPLRFGQTVAGGGPPDDASSAVAITHVTLIDGSGAAARPDMTVVVLGRRIASVAAAATASIPDGARIVDGRGRFLIPGLWDMHVHLSKARGSALALFVANGVTSVRDMGGDFAEIKAWRRGIDEGERIGPRILTAGPYLESPANVERMRREGVVEPVERTRVGVVDPEDARRVVAGLADEGVDFVKIRTFTDLETYRAIAQAARNEGLTIAGHAAGLSPDDILAAGQVSVEHGLFPPLARRPEEERRRIFVRFAQQGVAFVPTAVGAMESLLVSKDTAAAVVADTAGERSAPRRYVSQFLLEDWREQVEEKTEGAIAVMKSVMPLMLQDLRELREAGVRILPGTDTAVLLVYPGWSLHDELTLFVDELGMTPLEALRSATRDAAEFMGRGADLGTVAPGKLADLVILGENPLDAIENTRTIQGVVRNGTYLDREALDRLFEEVLVAPDLRQNDWTTAAAVRLSEQAEPHR